MRISSILNHRYLIIQNIEQTPYGSIDVVECQNTGKKYVAKSISKSADPIRIHQFHIEVDVLSQLNDPYIPELLDAWETENEFVLVQTYIQGITLKERMKNKISSKMKFKVICECMERINQVHQIGYLYLDLKPENIMIANQHVYLIDFNACIQKEAKTAYMASNENKSNELNDSVSKNETSDIYALGTLIQQLYSKDLWLKPFLSKCLNLNASLRYQDMPTTSRAFKRVFIWKKSTRILLILFLSVFMILVLFTRDSNAFDVYQKDPNPNTFFSAYLYTMNQKNGSKSEKSNQTLYQWIDEDWIDPSLYKDQRTMKFLVQQAIQSENPIVCKFIEKNVNKSFKEKNPYDYVVLQMYANQDNTISYLFLEEYFSYVDGLKDKEEIVSKINQIIVVLINGKIVLKDNEIQILMKQIHSNCKKMSNSQACLFLEYCLFLKSRNIQVDIPDDINAYFKDDEQWNELYDLYKTSKD